MSYSKIGAHQTLRFVTKCLESYSKFQSSGL